MLIQRISLLNFLSYRGLQNTNGEISPIEIDLRSSPLWLIYGPNGSGKSAIFDAITFALFKDHRGSGTENRGASYLISDGADQAKIELEININGKPYLIQREVKRNRNTASVSGVVHEWNGNEWEAIRGTLNQVEDWVKKNLRMSDKTFTSAVLLRQGEADAFLKAKPKERKERLLEILDLDFYKQLGDLASSKKNTVRSEAKRLEELIATLTKVDEQDIQTQSARITLLDQNLAKVREKRSWKDKELQDANLAVSVMKEIDLRESEYKNAKKFIQEEARILKNIKRFRELESDIPGIRNIHDVRERIQSELIEIAKVQQSVTSEEENLKMLGLDIKAAQKNMNIANTLFEKMNLRFAEAQDQKESFKEKVEQIKNVEKLEEQIEQAKSGLSPYKDILKRATRLEKDKSRYDALKAVIPLLEDLLQAKNSLASTHSEKKKDDQEMSGLLTWLSQKNIQAKGEEKKASSLRLEISKSESKFGKLLTKIDDLKGKIAERKRVSTLDECPICGSPLGADEVHSRIKKDVSHLRQELDQFQEQSKSDKAVIVKLSIALDSAETSLTKLRQDLATKETRKAVLESKLATTTINLRERTKQVKVLEVKCDKWATEVKNLDSLRLETTQLQKNNKDWKQLELARKEETKLLTIINTRQDDLAGLPNLPLKQRQKIRASYDDIFNEFETLEKEVKKAKETLQDLEKSFSTTSQRESSTRQTIQHLRDNIGDAEKRIATADAQLSSQLNRLPERLMSHPALSDKKLLAKMDTELRSLANADSEDAELKDARKKVAELDGKLSILRTQLGNIAKEHRRAVVDVQREYDEIQSEDQRLQGELKVENEKIGRMKSEQKEYDKHSSGLESKRIQLRYYDKLADAFGRTGLQAQIVQEAQQKLKDAANTTLNHLSNGMWQIELNGNDQGLEIFAQDISQPGMPQRPFEYLSGGEKFRVAISLAVAIGQSISGMRTVDTLIIDEGFGSLDEVNRDNLVKELTRLSDEVLSGGRVIIVSHEEDICEEFAHRLRISKNTDGLVSVEKFAG